MPRKRFAFGAVFFYRAAFREFYADGGTAFIKSESLARARSISQKICRKGFRKIKEKVLFFFSKEAKHVTIKGKLINGFLLCERKSETAFAFLGTATR